MVIKELKAKMFYWALRTSCNYIKADHVSSANEITWHSFHSTLSGKMANPLLASLLAQLQRKQHSMGTPTSIANTANSQVIGLQMNGSTTPNTSRVCYSIIMYDYTDWKQSLSLTW